MDKMPKQYSQKMYLFVIYGTFITILLGIFFMYTYSHYKKNELSSASKELENMRASVVNSITAQLDNLSTISLNIVYSNAIKKNFKEYSNLTDDILLEDIILDTSDFTNPHDKLTVIHDIVTAIIGAYQSASSIKLYTMDGEYIESGYWMRTTRIDTNSLSWYKDVVKLNGHKFITTPIVNSSLPAKGDNQKSKKFISLIRLFLKSNGEPEGIVEVIQDCDKIFSLVSQLESQNLSINVYIYNDRNELVYPYNPTKNIATNDSFFVNFDNTTSSDAIVTNFNNEKILFTSEKISNYNWNVILTTSESSVYESLYNFRTFFLLIVIISIFFTLLICFYISQILTLPLQKLSDITGQITINRVLSGKSIDLSSVNSKILELSTLCNSIKKMSDKLHTTSQEILLSRSEESRAKLQATQSLINPHFLYNCLTNISIMAEDNMNEDITKMCHALCDYFRYISSSQEMTVTLEEEIFYTKRYLECMKYRFHDELCYTININPNTANIYIPKLITQPIIENAFKYAFNKVPPWEISITSTIEHHSWIIKIQDNGGMLSEEKKKELLSLYQNLDLNEELKSMEIGGMGLKNIYLRLQLLYAEKAIFRIENSLPQKTIFILGGPIYYSREAYNEQHPTL